VTCYWLVCRVSIDVFHIFKYCVNSAEKNNFKTVFPSKCGFCDNKKCSINAILAQITHKIRCVSALIHAQPKRNINVIGDKNNNATCIVKINIFFCDIINLSILLMYCYYYSRQTGLWSHKFYNSTSCVHAVTVCAGEVNMEDYWELISCWFTPDLQLNNCRPSACWPIDRRRRAHIKDVAVVEPQAALCRRKVRRRRQILSVGANATPSTTKVWLIASGACWAAAGGGATDRCPSTDLPQSTLVSHRSQAHRFHTLHCGNAAYRILSISTEFHKTHAGNTRSGNLYQKLAQKIWRKFTTVSCTITTGRPITLNGSCHVLDSFCPGMELCSIACKKLYRKKLYNIDRHTCKCLLQDDLHTFLVQVSWACRRHRSEISSSVILADVYSTFEYKYKFSDVPYGDKHS